VTVAAGGRLISRTGTADLNLTGSVSLDQGAILVLDATANDTQGNLVLNGALALPSSGTVELYLPEERMGTFLVAEASGGVSVDGTLDDWALVLTGAVPDAEARLKIGGDQLLISVHKNGTVILVQ
jgi:hypothetical protein